MYHCKFLVKRIGYLYCDKQNFRTTLSQCKNCYIAELKPISEYKHTFKNKSVLKRLKTPLKQVSKKRQKLEKERYSLFTNDLNHCIEDKKHTGHIDKHECICGRNRNNSMKYGLVVPLCRTCHEDKDILLKWLFKGQEKFISIYGYDKFIEIFKLDYIAKKVLSKKII